jgi:hypothetical protein
MQTIMTTAHKVAALIPHGQYAITMAPWGRTEGMDPERAGNFLCSLPLAIKPWGVSPAENCPPLTNL